jgi:deoxycytidylate deaminase
VHHIDGDRTNNNPQNLQAVCRKDHRKVGGQFVYIDSPDQYFMNLAKYYSTRSGCGSRHVGAVIVGRKKDKFKVVSVGWNDSVVSYDKHLIDGKCPRKVLGFASGEGLHLCTAVHAETQAILAAAKVGKSTNNTTMYAYCSLPCKECAAKIINSGIREVVLIGDSEYYDKGIQSRELFEFAGVKLRIIEGLL